MKGNLIEPIFYIPAKDGDTEAALQLLNLLVRQVKEAEKQFTPCLIEYLTQAVERINQGESPEHALWLKGKGRGNKKKAKQTSLSIQVAKHIHLRLHDGERIKQICKELAEEGFVWQGKRICKSADSFEGYYREWKEALEEKL